MINWIKVEDELPVAPLGRVHILVEEEYIGQGMPQPPIKMLRMGDYTSEFCQHGESGYWEDDYGNRLDDIDEGGVEGNRVTHWARQIPGPDDPPDVACSRCGLVTARAHFCNPGPENKAK